MQKEERQSVRSELKTLVAEAAQSLATLDTDRLEELALSCQALNSDPSPERQQELAHQAQAAKRDMAVLAKVLEATRNNAAVMSRLRKLHESRMEYAASAANAGSLDTPMRVPEAPHGYH